MSALREIEPGALAVDIFETFLHKTPLLVAARDNKLNAMTIGWGMLGALWGKYCGVVYVRDCRYTYEFMEASDYFSVCVFGAGHKDALTLCGTRSGRDIDKVAATGLTPRVDMAPYFEEAELVIILKKLYSQPFDEACFTEAGQPHFARNYRAGNGPESESIHTQYVGEVVKVLAR